MVQNALITIIMVTVRFSYAEIIDVDQTAVDVEILANNCIVHAFRNYDATTIGKEICGNQTEVFELPDMPAALRMISSNPSYLPCSRDRSEIDQWS